MEKLCVKLETLEKIGDLLRNDDVKGALRLVDGLCDVEYRRRVNEAKRETYRRYKDGRLSGEDFSKLYGQLSSCLP